MANVLKWIWWRFNGYGYFWGMLTGVASAMLIPELVDRLAPADLAGQHINPLYYFPVIFGVSVLGCLLGTLLSQPEDDEILMSFYKTREPMGILGADSREGFARGSGVRAQSSFWQRLHQRVGWHCVAVVFDVAADLHRAAELDLGRLRDCHAGRDEHFHQVQLVRQIGAGRLGSSRKLRFSGVACDAGLNRWPILVLNPLIARATMN